MGIFNRNKKIIDPNMPVEERSVWDRWTNPVLGTLSLSTNNGYNTSTALKLSTVYRCISVLSDSIAILPLDNYIYQTGSNWKMKQTTNNLFNLLNIAPNPFMSAFTLKKMMTAQILLNGNCYILIVRDSKGDITSFQLLDPYMMLVTISNGDLLYTYKGSTQFKKEDIIHIMNYTVDGITGISTLYYADLCLTGSYSAEEHSNAFFSRGGNLTGILSPTAGNNLTSEKAKNAKDKFIASLDTSLGGASGSVVVLDSGLSYQPIQISPKDAQLLESRAFNLVTIAQFFGVPPSKIFSTQSSNYASVEANSLEFLNSAIQPLCEKIEIEFYRKIYTPVEYSTTELKFDVSNLLRMDAATQASWFSQLFNLGALSVNEIREKIDAAYPVKNGNKHWIGVQVQDLENPVVSAPVIPLDNNAKTNITPPVDNPPADNNQPTN